jgi:Tol biopolymer transport system component
MSDSKWDIWTVPLDQDSPTKRLLKGSPSHEYWNAVSPNGRWLAYASDTTGLNEIYMAPFDNPNDQTRRVTRDAGSHVVWSSTGDRLFYAKNTSGSRPSLFSVDVALENDAISTGPPQEFLKSTSRFTAWQIDAKGERVLVLEPPSQAEPDGTDSEHNVVHMVSNFFEVLKEKAPPAGK